MIRSCSGVTSFNLPATSDRGIDSTSLPFMQTIRPNCLFAISSVACPPKRVAKLRSKEKDCLHAEYTQDGIAAFDTCRLLYDTRHIDGRTLFCQVFRSLRPQPRWNKAYQAGTVQDPLRLSGPCQSPVQVAGSHQHLRPSRHIAQSSRRGVPSPPPPLPVCANWRSNAGDQSLQSRY